MLLLGGVVGAGGFGVSAGGARGISGAGVGLWGFVGPKLDRRGINAGEAGVFLHAAQAFPAQIYDVGGHGFLAEGIVVFALVKPPLGGHGHHADKGLTIQYGGVGVEAGAGEGVPEKVRDLGYGVVKQGGVATTHAGLGVADQYLKTVGFVLHICEQRDDGLLDAGAGSSGAERLGNGVLQAGHFAVDYHRVQALFAAKVFIHNRFGNPCSHGYFFHTGAFETTFCKEAAPNGNELFSPLFSGHALPYHAFRLRGTPQI